MKKTKDITSKVLFNVKWKFLPPQKKYAILWARTLKSLTRSESVPETNQGETLLGG